MEKRGMVKGMDAWMDGRIGALISRMGRKMYVWTECVSTMETA